MGLGEALPQANFEKLTPPNCWHAKIADKINPVMNGCGIDDSNNVADRKCAENWCLKWQWSWFWCEDGGDDSDDGILLMPSFFSHTGFRTAFC